MNNFTVLPLKLVPSVQVTAQAPDMDQARYLYDQMLVLGPLLVNGHTHSPTQLPICPSIFYSKL